ncbi:MAG TPA: mechanosensitive ion channel domain-containing protein [Vicinamibacterales bacterium]
MLETIDFDRIETALSTRHGWVDLGLVAVCLASAWLAERRALRARGEDGAAQKNPRLHASFTRIVFPVTGLALVALASFVYRRYVGAPFFLAIATPMLIALGAIRMIVYGMRRLFHAERWLPTSERTISFTVWGLFVLYLLGLLPEIANALDEVRIPIGKTQISLMAIGTAVLAVVFTLIVTLWISGLIEQRLLRATHIDSNLRAVLAKFVKAVLLVVAVLIALSTIGFDLTLLSVFGGALGVGIGLGLQKLASNYIAGFTILLDRSIRLGDMVTVDGRMGQVSKVTARYVVVRSLDGVDALVPNETLVTTTVLNHSYTAPDIRIPLPLAITYESDVERALAILEECARGTPRVLLDRNPPVAQIASFDGNGINLELGFWISDPENGRGNVRSEIYRAILKAFAANDIRMPNPQRDIRIVNLPSGLSAAVSPDAANPSPTPQNPSKAPG